MFQYQNTELYIENVSLKSIAKQFGTPCYVYSETAIVNQFEVFEKAFGQVNHQMCYAVKANSNPQILKIFAERNAGFDIVSGGELALVLQAGGDPRKIIFSGVGKSVKELEHALEIGIGCFNIESSAELERLAQLAKKHNVIANIAIRVNPNIDSKTHPYIATGLNSSKFGIEYDAVLPIILSLKQTPHIRLIGLACHIGSQILELTPFSEAIDRVLALIAELKNHGILLQNINVGGGLGVRYSNENPPDINDYVAMVVEKLKDTNLKILIEPGRILMANAGILLTRIEYIKKTSLKNFAIVDAGMNDFMRPTLYNAWHDILPVEKHSNEETLVYDVVGPVCESGDYFGKDRSLSVASDDLLVICSAGAYGFCMASNYNSRPKPAEVLVKENEARLINVSSIRKI